MSAFEDYQEARRRKQAEAKERAKIQTQNRTNEWDAIGGFLGGINKGIGDFFNGLPANQRKASVQRNSQKKPTSTGSIRKLPSSAGLDVSASRSKPGQASASYPTPKYANKQLFDEANYRGPSGPQQPQTSLFDELLGKVTSDWSGIDKSKIDYSPLDQALNARLGALNGIRDKSNQNFEKSDVALEGMHRAQQNRMNTEGVSRYNNIADTQKQNLTASNDIAQNNLAQVKADDMAKRQAMLQNLGIQAAGAQEDSSAGVLNQTIGSIESREQADLVNADQDRASNLAYNQGMVNSVGQQGVERRSDLAQQLQTILGRVDMAQADAQSENAQARYQLEQQEGARQYDQFQNQRGFLSDTMGMMQDDALKREEMAMKQSQMKPPEVGGFAGLGQDLLNTGYDPREVQNAMNILATVTAGDYRKGIDPNAGYDQASVLNKVLQKNGVTSPMLAFQLATNYANMGNTSKYQDLPY